MKAKKKSMRKASGKEGDIARQRKVEFPFYYSPGKRMVHVLGKLRDEPGALASLLNVLAPKVDFLGTSSYGIGEGQAIFSGFGVVLSRANNAKSIKAALEGIPQLLDCRVRESKDGLLVDLFHTGYQSGNGESYVMFPAAQLVGTFNQIVRVFGSGGETILYLMGKSFGETLFEENRAMLGPNPARRMEEASHIYGALGYGSSSISRENSGKVLRLVQRDCFECSTLTRNRRACTFTRGLAVGSFSAILGKIMSCTETRCRLKGSKECEFVLTVEDDI